MVKPFYTNISSTCAAVGPFSSQGGHSKLHLPVITDFDMLRALPGAGAGNSD